MYTPRYLKYWQFAEAIFSIEPPCLRTFYRQKCYARCRNDHDALREITWSSSTPSTRLYLVLQPVRTALYGINGIYKYMIYECAMHKTTNRP